MKTVIADGQMSYQSEKHKMYQKLLFVTSPRAGTDRELVPESLLLAGTITVTIAFWACPQLENIHLNENNNQPVCLSLARVHGKGTKM